MRSTIVLFIISMIVVKDPKLEDLRLPPRQVGTNFEMNLMKTEKVILLIYFLLLNFSQYLRSSLFFSSQESLKKKVFLHEVVLIFLGKRAPCAAVVHFHLEFQYHWNLGFQYIKVQLLRQ